jgi:hypothetical protein
MHLKVVRLPVDEMKNGLVVPFLPFCMLFDSEETCVLNTSHHRLERCTVMLQDVTLSSVHRHSTPEPPLVSSLSMLEREL